MSEKLKQTISRMFADKLDPFTPVQPMHVWEQWMESKTEVRDRIILLCQEDSQSQLTESTTALEAMTAERDKLREVMKKIDYIARRGTGDGAFREIIKLTVAATAALDEGE